jgi:hypothetical protein
VPGLGAVNGDMTLADRVFSCGCRHCADRDTNSAVNLARRGQTHHQTSPDPRTPKQRGRATNARYGTALTSTLRVPVKPARLKRELTFTPRQRPEPDDGREGRCRTLNRVVRHAFSGPMRFRCIHWRDPSMPLSVWSALVPTATLAASTGLLNFRDRMGCNRF